MVVKCNMMDSKLIKNNVSFVKLISTIYNDIKFRLNNTQ